MTYDSVTKTSHKDLAKAAEQKCRVCIMDLSMVKAAVCIVHSYLLDAAPHQTQSLVSVMDQSVEPKFRHDKSRLSYITPMQF